MKNNPLSENGAFTLLCIATMAPFYFYFATLDDVGRGRAAAIAAGDLLVVARIGWSQRGQWWFWATIASLGLAHAYLVEEYLWSSERLLWISLLPIAVLDIAVSLGIVKIVQFIAAHLIRRG